MKSIRRLLVSSLVLTAATAIAVIAFSARSQASPGTDRIKEDAKATYAKAKDTVNDVVAEVKGAAKQGSHKANETASTVKVQVKTTVRKANEVTTSVYTATHHAVTNANTQVKEKIKSVTR